MDTHSKLDALLEPSLGGSAPTLAPYSVRTSFLVAFFGGPIGHAVIAIRNAHRLGRLRSDMWHPLAAAIAWCGALLWSAIAVARGTFPEELILLSTASRTVRTAGSALALALFGFDYFRLQKTYRSAELLGREQPRGLGPGLLAIAIASVISFLLAFLGDAMGATP